MTYLARLWEIVADEWRGPDHPDSWESRMRESLRSLRTEVDKLDADSRDLLARIDRAKARHDR